MTNEELKHSAQIMADKYEQVLGKNDPDTFYKMAVRTEYGSAIDELKKYIDYTKKSIEECVDLVKERKAPFSRKLRTMLEDVTIDNVKEFIEM